MSDPFLKMIEKKNDQKKQECKDALLFAKSEAHTDSGRRFVADLQRQFDERGTLTPRQIEALYKVDSTASGGFYAYEDEDQDDWEFGDLSQSDFAGGDPSW